MTVVLLLTALAAGLAAGWWLAVRRHAGGVAADPPAAEGPPLLEWVLRANPARGVWLIGPGVREAALSGAGLGPTIDRMVVERLEHHRQGDGQTVERLDAGTLLIGSLDGFAAGLLLSPGTGAAVRERALRDLARLLDHHRLRPVLADVAREQEQPGESVESIALRLSSQLERLLGAEAVVCLARPTGVEVVGVSLRSDRRMVGVVAADGSPLAQVACGEIPELIGVDLPLGGPVTDRRKAMGPAYVCRIPGEGAPVGAVAVWTPSGAPPSGQALAHFRIATDNAGPRFVAAIVHRELEEAAVRDPLTGLLNRRGLAGAMTLTTPDGTPPYGAMICADLDRFKVLNDSLGHHAGDAALTHFARLFKTAARGRDVAARVGGEEFALWLPGASLERGREVAERVRQGLAWAPWTWQGREWPLTASFGVAAIPETAQTREVLSVQADRALYEAKRTGRDRVVVAALRGGGPRGAFR